MDHCNCGHDHDCDHHHHHETVTISLDGETDVECTVIGTFDVNDKDYIALLPMEDEEILIFSFKEHDGEVELNNIETDEEYEMVTSAFSELFLIGDDLDDDFDDEFDDDEFDDDESEEE